MDTNAKTTAIRFGIKNEWGHIPGCQVIGCNRKAETMWTPMMAGKPARPVCLFHDKRNLWLYKGAIYDHTEEL